VKCYICRRSRADFDELLRLDSSRIEVAINQLRVQIVEHQENYKILRRHFIENKGIVQNLRPEIASLKISTIKNDVETFQRMTPELALILQYFDELQPSGATTVADVAALISREPLFSNIPEVIGLEDLISKLSSAKFDASTVKFVERTIEKTEIGAFPVEVDRVVNQLTRSEAQPVESYSTPKFTYCLCPICNSVLQESARGAFRVIEAANDFGEDEDFQ